MIADKKPRDLDHDELVALVIAIRSRVRSAVETVGAGELDRIMQAAGLEPCRNQQGSSRR